MHGVETRLSQRTSFRKTVEIALSAVEATQKGNVSSSRRGYGIDISSTGMGLEINFVPEIGSILSLHVPLSDADIKMPVLAQVQWVVSEGERHRAGLRFLA